jgi:nitrogen regulatory protein PII
MAIEYGSAMKLIKCVIRPEKVEEVVTKLQNVATGLTVTEVRGHGAQKGHKLLYRGREYDVSLIPKMMIDIVSDDNRVDDVIKIVTETAHTGEIGDGRIFVFPVDETYHVRTGFMDLG